MNNGISISSRGGSGGLNIGFWGTLIVFLIEAGCAGFFAAGMGAGQVELPYCEKCYDWVPEKWTRVTDPETLGTLAQKIEEAGPDDHLPNGCLVDLPAGDVGQGHGKLVLRGCPGCREGYLSLSLLMPEGDKKEMKETIVLSQVHLTKNELAEVFGKDDQGL
jgi:hypothetical protein